MSQAVYHIPDLFLSQEKEDVHVHFYGTDQSSERNRVKFSQHLICFLRKGHKEVWGEHRKVGFGPDQILLLQAGNTLMTERTTSEKEYKSTLFFFSNEFLLNLSTESRMDLIAGREQSDALLLFPKDDFLLNFQESLGLLGREALRSMTIREAKARELLLYLYRTHPDSIRPFFQRCLAQVRHRSFRETVEAHGPARLSNEELAFLCNMSLSTFKRKFSEAFGSAPQQYFKRQRMQEAARLLLKGHRPSDIYHQLGYEGLSSFSREFKKHFKVSPGNYP